jgi:hypothetical protein
MALEGSAMEIPGIPENIQRARVVELINALGIDVKQLRALRIEPRAVHAEVYALKDGNRFWDGAWQPDSRVATHHITIPIADQPDAAEIGRSVVDAIKAYENR